MRRPGIRGVAEAYCYAGANPISVNPRFCLKGPQIALCPRSFVGPTPSKTIWTELSLKNFAPYYGAGLSGYRAEAQRFADLPILEGKGCPSGT